MAALGLAKGTALLFFYLPGEKDVFLTEYLLNVVTGSWCNLSAILLWVNYYSLG